MKKLKAENPCNMDLNSRGGGGMVDLPQHLQLQKNCCH